MSLYVLAIGMTIVANVGYHLCQRTIRPDVSPAASLVVTYAVALVLSAVCWRWLDSDPSDGVGAALRRVGPASAGLGACVVLLELGFLLAYRAGWDVGVAALYSNAAMACILLPLGWWLFAEGITPRKALGLAFAIVGLVLLSGKGHDAPRAVAPGGTQGPST